MYSLRKTYSYHYAVFIIRTNVSFVWSLFQFQSIQNMKGSVLYICPRDYNLNWHEEIINICSSLAQFLETMFNVICVCILFRNAITCITKLETSLHNSIKGDTFELYYGSRKNGGWWFINRSQLHVELKLQLPIPTLSRKSIIQL